ncbi:AAA ATPase central domain protein [Leptothrix cholodnii SP-6]|uniref:AAA ATPase central domain protein n=1 Tax=Leptothrix cholodnii (strain ATCC 51168 / LMG 8142 / SP-6) TaxID=395495 RepID=B1Y1R3_LEPCP|nr:ATP-binding protein [Leptothrix cholodnii]ACB35525.1 AAA ATPase central domain protein [Leptothrix cholodnii SP-6]
MRRLGPRSTAGQTADTTPDATAARRVARLAATRGTRPVVSPALHAAPVLDLLCSHFVLTLTLRHAPRFTGRRDWNSLLALTARHLVWPTTVLARLREFLARRVKGHDGWARHEQLDDAAFLAKHGWWHGPYDESTLFFYLDDYVKDAPKDLMSLLGCTAEWLGRELRAASTLVQKNVDVLGALLQLNPAERALLLYGTLARYQRDLRGLLVEFKVSSAQEAYATLAEVAGVDEREVAEALRAGSRLERVGMIENLISEHNITDLADLMKVSDQLPPVLMREYRDPQDLMAVFTRPSVKSELGAADFGYVAEELQVLTTLLGQAVQRREAGVNVLLYGPPGTGKTELARVAAQAAGLDLYEVEYADRDGNSLSGRDRYRSLQISQVFLKASPQVALLFDEVEDVFPPISSDAAQLIARLEAGESGAGHSVNGKAWVNQILETNPVPVIWLTNRIEQIDPAFRRRFQYHLELKSPPPGAREALVTRALSGAAVSPAFCQRLAERPALTPAQIRTAVRFARLVGAPEGDDVEALIERQIAHADLALGNRPGASRAQRPVVTRYDLGLLNIESRYPVERIVESLRLRGHGALCFYGPPGTGKTALAEHIAEQLKRPLMIRQASDLMSKYVGETEQAMARMFDAAEHEQAVLLLDEADSFLRSRQRAERNYEVTEVNQMLQGMERFGGIFICTTNLFTELDEAALRRFTFKIAFQPLTAEQRVRMYVAEALGGDAGALNAERSTRLAHLDQLACGDFAAVQRQAEILGAALDADEFLSQLEAEHRVKPQVRERRGIGFLR